MDAPVTCLKVDVVLILVATGLPVDVDERWASLLEKSSKDQWGLLNHFFNGKLFFQNLVPTFCINIKIKICKVQKKMNFSNYFMTKQTTFDPDQITQDPLPKIQTEQLDFCGQSPDLDEPQAPTVRYFPYTRLPRSFPPPEIITHFQESGQQSPPPPPPTTRIPPPPPPPPQPQIPFRLPPPIPLSFGPPSLPSITSPVLNGPLIFDTRGGPPKMPLPQIPGGQVPRERYPKFVRF
jgi:hypothetical protein